jgi:CheY-like chemotaxis protein
MKYKQLNILLADDDKDDCIFFKQALEEIASHTNLITVNDGDELIASLLGNIDHLPHIIFLDINMPRKNGLECLKEIKSHDLLSEIPVVMFSTTNEWDVISMLFKSGANVYIHKPNDFAQLKQVLHHALPIAAEKVFSNSPIKYILNATVPEDPGIILMSNDPIAE